MESRVGLGFGGMGGQLAQQTELPGFVANLCVPPAALEELQKKGPENDKPDVPRLIQRRVRDLRLWPGYEDIFRSRAVRELQAKDTADGFGSWEPLFVTLDGQILEGCRRWMVAQQQRISYLWCLEFAFSSEAEALIFFLAKHAARPDSLSPFSRVRLALELKPALAEKAKERQRDAGRRELLSDLTKGAAIDVRREIARIAHVSSGNVAKTEQTLESACPELLLALQQSEITIHRAHQWSKHSPQAQQRSLDEWRTRKDINTTISQLLAKHIGRATHAPVSAASLVHGLAAHPSDLGDIEVQVVDVGGKRLFVSRELFANLEIRQSGRVEELSPIDARASR